MLSTTETIRGASPIAPKRSRGNRALGFAKALALAVLTINLLQACSFGSPEYIFGTPQEVYGVLNQTPYVDDSTVYGNRWPVIDDAKMKVWHGYLCASAPQAATEEYIGLRVWDSATLPDNFEGTVYMNGWYLEYHNGDHHVGGLGSVIFNIAQNGNQLSWDAGGVISDKNGDDAYTWCHNYTIVAWEKATDAQSPRVDMKAVHANDLGKGVYVDRTLATDNMTMKPSKLRTPGMKPRARLLAGFGVGFSDNDHHLLQFVFDLGDAEVKRKKIKWTTDVVFKDNSSRSYYASQLATVVGGKSVHTWKPETVMLRGRDRAVPIYNDIRLEPRDSDSNSCYNGASEHLYVFYIENVPFTWAMPMLTGWEVGDYCDDNHVKRVGAWIDDFAWVKSPNEPTGTLHWSVRTVLQDKEPESAILDRMQIEVLGVNLLQPAN